MVEVFPVKDQTKELTCFVKIPLKNPHTILVIHIPQNIIDVFPSINYLETERKLQTVLQATSRVDLLSCTDYVSHLCLSYAKCQSFLFLQRSCDCESRQRSWREREKNLSRQDLDGGSQSQFRYEKKPLAPRVAQHLLATLHVYNLLPLVCQFY